jgi:hypothetical protein
MSMSKTNFDEYSMAMRASEHRGNFETFPEPPIYEPSRHYTIGWDSKNSMYVLKPKE